MEVAHVDKTCMLDVRGYYELQVDCHFLDEDWILRWISVSGQGEIQNPATRTRFCEPPRPRFNVRSILSTAFARKGFKRELLGGAKQTPDPLLQRFTTLGLRMQLLNCYERRSTLKSCH